MKKMFLSVFVFCLLIIINGCLTQKITKKIKEAKNRKIVLTEYKEAVLKDDCLYLGYIACDSAKNDLNDRIPIIAKYNLNSINTDASIFVDASRKPELTLNAYVQKQDGEIEVPIYFINVTPYCYSRYDPKNFNAAINLIDIANLKGSGIYVVYEHLDKIDGTIEHTINNSQFLFIWHSNHSNTKKNEFMVFDAPKIDVPLGIRDKFLYCLWPFSFIIELPIMIPVALCFFVAWIGGYNG